MGSNRTKVAVIGAGFVGATTAFVIALKQMVNELVIIDVLKEKAAGEAMDINHALPFLGQMVVRDGDYSDCADCDAIIITAGANRKPGETRIDLARKNVTIAKGIVENVMKYYTRGVIIDVANPVDILTYKIQKWSGLPNGRVFGTGTTLDSIRLRYLLSQKVGIDVKNIHGYIIGEHGDSQLPIWSATYIAGKSINEYFNDPKQGINEEDKEALIADVKTAGAEIIKKKGATYYGIAVATSTLLESVLKNQNTIRPVSTVIQGNYGITDVALSLPSVVNANGVSQVLEMTLTDKEIEGLRYSAEQLKAILAEVKDI